MNKGQSFQSGIALAFSDMSRIPVRVWIAPVVAVLAIVALLLFAPAPSVSTIRDLVHSTGAWGPLTYIVLMVLATQLPIPRTVWTVAAGVIFGVRTGILVALIGLVISAALSLTLIKTLGGRAISTRAKDNVTLDRLLGIVAERGWIAVLGLRMVPAVPFSILNYACGAAMIPMAGFLAATLVGSAPNTIATVVIADAAATGTPSWVLLLTIPVYLVGIVVSLREVAVWKRTMAEARESASE